MDTTLEYFTLFTFIRSYGSTLLFYAVMCTCTSLPVQCDLVAILTSI